MKKNIVRLTDSYKVTHWKQYPPETQFVYSYFESRGGKFNNTVFFGLQYILKEYLEGVVINQEKIDNAANAFNAHFNNLDKEYAIKLFNREGWEYILNNHGGKLPVVIKAVPEGSVIPVSNVLMTIENTDPQCYWLTNYLETLLVQVWYPCTVATQSREMKRILLRYASLTGNKDYNVNFSLHDFGFRGVSSVESAALGAAAHLINFRGTDTFVGIDLIQDYYEYQNFMPGFSIPAYEHSTVTTWGRSGESKCLSNGLHQFPDGLMAIVIDSYDMFAFCSKVLSENADLIKNRRGKLIVRPDSGQPEEIVVRVLDMLSAQFGFSYTTNGYKMLPNYIGVIVGDGINFDSLSTILEAITKAGYCTLNVAFGSGGGLLQQLNRDTCSFAFKCSNVVINGDSRFVYKEPITGKAKKSKRGRLCLFNQGNGIYITKENCEHEDDGVLRKVFENGELINTTDFASIVNRAQLESWSNH